MQISTDGARLGRSWAALGEPTPGNPVQTTVARHQPLPPSATKRILSEGGPYDVQRSFELARCETIGADHLVVHAGSATDGDRRAGLGRDRVLCWHLNDSAADRGSAIDHHTRIGAGGIGLDGFRQLARDPRWFDVPMTIETPKDANVEEANRRNLATLRALRAGDP